MSKIPIYSAEAQPNRTKRHRACAIAALAGSRPFEVAGESTTIPRCWASPGQPGAVEACRIAYASSVPARSVC
jgi:hypothetical protein